MGIRPRRGPSPRVRRRRPVVSFRKHAQSGQLAERVWVVESDSEPLGKVLGMTCPVTFMHYMLWQ